MKKILLLCVPAFMAVLAASCCGSGECNADGCDTAVAKATLDSISVAQGTYIGEAVLSNYSMISRDGEVSKEELIKGIQLVLGAGDSRATQIGMQFGLQMLNEMKQLETLGIEVDKATVIANFKKAFLQDTINKDQAQLHYGEYQRLVNAVQDQIKAREEARIAASPEAVKNVADGEAYVAAAKKADPEVQTAESGLSYKIIDKGQDESITDRSKLNIKYNEKKLDGTTVMTTGESGRNAYPANLVPGLSEGVKMLGKGGKAVFYVPGKLAYGVRGLAHRDVGPNEMLVYEVEILDVE